MDLIRNVQVDFTIMKEPRGFIRLIQFVLAILAFATICTSATAKIHVPCTSNKTESFDIKYSYPFRISSIKLVVPFCSPHKVSDPKTPFDDISFAAGAQFFCFIGVMSFLLCIAYFIAYVLFSAMFVNDSRAATVDLVFSAVWTVLWFIASTAWADRLNIMGQALNPDTIISDLKLDKWFCGDGSVDGGNKYVKHCGGGEGGSHATLVMSVLFGYLNMAVWGAGLWFLYKETKWHKEPEADTQQFDQPHSGGSAPADAGYQADGDAAPTY